MSQYVEGSTPNGLKNQKIKSGVVAGASFAGSPKKYTVSFTTSFPDTNYGITITSSSSRSFTYESKTTSGFTINANAAATVSGEVSWLAKTTGEI